MNERVQGCIADTLTKNDGFTTIYMPTVPFTNSALPASYIVFTGSKM